MYNTTKVCLSADRIAAKTGEVMKTEKLLWDVGQRCVCLGGLVWGCEGKGKWETQKTCFLSDRSAIW